MSWLNRRHRQLESDEAWRRIEDAALASLTASLHGKMLQERVLKPNLIPTSITHVRFAVYFDGIER